MHRYQMFVSGQNYGIITADSEQEAMDIVREMAGLETDADILAIEID